MARYWVYLNDQVAGPYSVEQLIRTRGFSRQTLVCVDDNSGKPGSWISSADIPDLAHIFKAVDEVHDRPVPPAPRKTVPKMPPPRPVSRPAPAAAPVPAATPSKRFTPALWISALIFLLLAGGTGFFFWQQHNQSQVHDREAVQNLVEDAPLPSSSLYASLRHFFTAKQIAPRWEFEHPPTGLYNVNVSYYTGNDSQPGRAVVYSFEVNLEAQTVRGLNTAAEKLLSEGFPSPASPTKTPTPKPAKSLAQQFPGVLSQRVQAFEKGDFSDVWQMFSQHKRSQMIQAGMSESGFVRLQNLTHGLESGIKQSVLKTKEDSPDHMLVLLRQSQPNHPDIFVKQQWVVDEDQWKLEDEEKKSAPQPVSDGGGTIGAGKEAPQASQESAAPPAPQPVSSESDSKEMPAAWQTSPAAQAATAAPKPAAGNAASAGSPAKSNVLTLPGVSQ